MIKAYLVGIPSFYEDEDIEVQYCIYEEATLVSKKTVVTNYVKPALVGQVALRVLLKELKKYIDQEIVIIINDNLLYESMKGILRTKKIDLIKKAAATRKIVAQYKNITIKDVSRAPMELENWNQALQNIK